MTNTEIAKKIQALEQELYKQEHLVVAAILASLTGSILEGNVQEWMQFAVKIAREGVERLSGEKREAK